LWFSRAYYFGEESTCFEGPAMDETRVATFKGRGKGNMTHFYIFHKGNGGFKGPQAELESRKTCNSHASSAEPYIFFSVAYISIKLIY
jgi:hypothetical protein